MLIQVNKFGGFSQYFLLMFSLKNENKLNWSQLLQIARYKYSLVSPFLMFKKHVPENP